MAVSGCHNCRKLSPPGTPYEESACAACNLANEHYVVKSTRLFDSDIPPEELEERGPSTEESEQPPLPISEKTLALVKEACESSVCMVLASTVLRMVELAKCRPVMFEALVLKLRFPHMSYYDIGVIMHCSKQNVLYHLKQAVHVFPELATAIITDTRFSGGRYAIKTAATAQRKENGMDGLRRNIYGKVLDAGLLPMEAINKILSAPYMSAEAELTAFDSYAKDEEDPGNEIAPDTVEFLKHMERLLHENQHRS